MANAQPQLTLSNDTRCHFFRLALELRDSIYDYVAYQQTSVDLYVNLETPAEPKLYAYDEGRALSRASSRLRTEYMARLLRRIKQLDVDHQPHLVLPLSTPTYASTTLMVSERKVSRNTWVQDNVAFRWVIPFEGSYDNGQKQSTLRLTVASNTVRAFDQKFGLPAGLGFEVPEGDPLSTTTGPSKRFEVPEGDLLAAMTTLQRLKNVAELDARNWWTPWWDVYQVRWLYCDVDSEGVMFLNGRWYPEEFRLG
jgi:hypothetical protein